MKKERYLIVSLCLLLLCSLVMPIFAWDVCAAQKGNEEAKATQELENLYARSAVLMDADSGRILYGKDEDHQMPMASTTKIMTCILVLETTDLEEKAVVSEYAQNQPKVHLGALKDETYYVEDLLYSLMLESHNDSAVILAEHVSGSVEGFAKLMNQKAEEIGCTDTHFVTPNGLDASDEAGKHVTTAKDLAKIMRYCIGISDKKEEFLKITQAPSYQFSDVSGERTFSCTNHNAFLGMMEGALSGKTGFTADAGYCYVGALSQDGETYIVALLACGWPNHKNYKWQDTQKLMTYGLEHYSYQNIWKHITLPEVKVTGTMESGAVKQEIEIKDPPQELKVLIWEGEEPRIEMEIKETLQAPVKKGEVIGVIRYWIDDKFLGEWEVISCENAEKKTLGKVYKRLVKYMLRMSIFYPY